MTALSPVTTIGRSMIFGNWAMEWIKASSLSNNPAMPFSLKSASPLRTKSLGCFSNLTDRFFNSSVVGMFFKYSMIFGSIPLSRNSWRVFLLLPHLGL